MRSGAAATVALDTAPAGSNSTAARIDVAKITIDPAGNPREWDVSLQQLGFAVTAGVAYDISFRAHSTNAEHPINISMQKPSTPYNGYFENSVTLKAGYDMANLYRNRACQCDRHRWPTLVQLVGGKSVPSGLMT
ncbi:MAG: carbohydrate binding domain-containing protein [Cellvibrio sp.]|nr:carbohydrate binding domain-containing protein [Cellvibrio sp.]